MSVGRSKTELRQHAEALAGPINKLVGHVVAKGMVGILERCVEMQDRITELEVALTEAQENGFYRGVIGALGALAPHSTHGDTLHDEIVQVVGKAQLYAAAEPEDVDWAGLDPKFYAALRETAQSSQPVKRGT